MKRIITINRHGLWMAIDYIPRVDAVATFIEKKARDDAENLLTILFSTAQSANALHYQILKAHENNPVGFREVFGDDIVITGNNIEAEPEADPRK